MFERKYKVMNSFFSVLGEKWFKRTAQNVEGNCNLYSCISNNNNYMTDGLQFTVKLYKLHANRRYECTFL